MLYLTQVILYTAAMLLIYLLLLRNSPLYRFSRIYLLACATMPLFIPFIKLPQVVGLRLQQVALFQIDLPAITISAAHQVSGISNAIPAIWLGYAVIAVLFMIWYLWHLFRLWIIIRNNKKVKKGTYTLVTSSGHGPGSFGRFVFFPEDEVNETILAHEQAHIRLHHTLDIIFLNGIQALLWPNIFLVWIRKEIKEVHEFQADAAVHVDKEDYARLLLSSIFNTHTAPVMHLFIIHPIKRRIMMLQKNGKASLLKTSLMVCSAFIFFLFIATSIQSCGKKTDGAAITSKTSNDENIDSRVKHALLNPPPNLTTDNYTPDNNGIYAYVHKMPEPSYNYQSYLAQNIHYPQNAKEKGIGGKVIIRFVVDENGNIKNPKCVRSAGNSLDDEALRVVSMMPPWKPGEENGQKVPVYFTMPIIFSPK